MIELKMLETDSRDGLVILTLFDANGEHYSVKLNSLDVASLIGSLRASLEEAVGHPSAESVALPEMTRVQYVETPEIGFFRVFVNDRIYHEYPVRNDTVLGSELKLFGDRVVARNEAQATHQQHGTRN